jgi:glycosyltransferase involved in cell wall biosynthesis
LTGARVPPLRVLITNVTLKTRTGTELYVRDLALGLAARGHEPVVYARDAGELADELTAAGIAVHTRLPTVRTPPDIIHCHHTEPTIEALLRFPYTPAMYVCHDGVTPADTPPVFAPIRRHVAVDENCRERLLKAGVDDGRILVIGNAVDLRRFRPRPPLPETPRRALLFSNYASDTTHLPAVRQACAERGVPLDVMGSASGCVQAAPEDVLPAYDLVFAKARCALEAMAVGAAVIVCDAWGLGPMVTRAQVEHLRRWNFGIRALTRPVAAGCIGEEMARYDRNDAAEVSRWVREAASLDRCVEDLVKVYRDVIAEYAALPVREAHVLPRTLRRALPGTGLRNRLRRVPVLGRAIMAVTRGARDRRLRARALRARRRPRPD